MTGLRGLIDKLGQLVEDLILLMVGVALLVFFYGLAKFILRVGGDEKAVSDGKNLMIWGLVALFVMVSVWGIIAFFQGDLGVGSGGVIQLQTL